ncbi:MAG: glycosyltransferase [Candidatus Rokubacteria bacterium]|nr:glycosyltransferase [Candidatus Rokubacteria bacterium]
MTAAATNGLLLVYHLAVLVALAVLARRTRAPGGDLTLEPAFPERTAAPPRIDVVVPARNERENLPACVGALLGQRGVELTVTVVDDDSSDGTREVAEALARADGRVRLMRAPALPPGWIGKVHALHHGVAVTDAPWLLFVDADVTTHRDALATAVREAVRRGVDVLSLSPWQRAQTFGERLVQPVVFALLDERFSMAAVNDPASRVSAANGQFLLFRRAAYEAIGGHAAVRGEVLEDVALARRAKGAGFRLFFGTTRTMVEARMYRSFAALWEGWSKNLFLLLGARVSSAFGLVLRDVAVWVLPLVTAPIAWGLASRGPGGAASAAAAGAAIVMLFTQAARLVGGSPVPITYLFLVPFGKLIVGMLIMASWWKHAVTGSVGWKGRRYPRGPAGER